MCKEWNLLKDFCFFNLALAVSVLPILQSYSWLVFYVCERSFFLDVKSQEEAKKKKKLEENVPENHALLQKELFFLTFVWTSFLKPWGLTSDFFYICLSPRGDRHQHNEAQIHLVKHHKSSVSLSVRSFLWPTNGIKNK